MHANPASADMYERLGVAPDATSEQVKAAFRQMRKELHPDSRPESLRGHFNTLMQNVNEAHQTLTDPRARAKYDARRRYRQEAQQPQQSQQSQDRQRNAAQEDRAARQRQEEARAREQQAEQQRRQREAERRRREEEARRRAEEEAQAREEEEWYWADDQDEEPARREAPGEPEPAGTAGVSVVHRIPGPVHRVAIYTAGSWAWLAGCYVLWQLPFVGPLVAVVVGLGVPAATGLVLLKTAFALPTVERLVGFLVPSGGRFTTMWFARRLLEAAVLAPVLFFVASIFSGVFFLLSLGALVYVGLWVAEFYRWRGRRQVV